MNYKDQIGRIRKKLQSAKEIDNGLKVFGAGSHKYTIGKPVSEGELEAFEKEYDLTLPKCYREFLLYVGNGGISFAGSAAGPFYGIYPFGENVDELLEDPKPYLKLPACIKPGMTDDYWDGLKQRIDEDDDITDEEYFTELGKIFSGLLPLGSQGCSYIHGLVLNGEHRGRMVNLDIELQKPSFAFEKNFLDWYERWLDEIIAGILLQDEPAWFGYSMGGDDRHLMEVYHSANDFETKKEALIGLRKLITVAPETCDMLLELCKETHSKLRHQAVRMLAKFDYAKAVDALRGHLHGDDEDCLAAGQSIFWHARERAGDWNDDVRRRLPAVNDEETFRFLTYLLAESGIDYGIDLKPFCTHGNEEIRICALYTLGKLESKASLLDTFLEGLNDSSVRVVHTTLQALNGVTDPKLAPAYRQILERFQTDEYHVLTNLRYRLTDMGLATTDAFSEETDQGRSERQNMIGTLS